MPGFLLLVMSTNTRAFLLISVLIWLVYATSLKFGFTELDDSIFYRDFAELFSTWKNAPGLFSRGVFTEHTDTYYRPLLMLSFLTDQQITKSISFYHVVNICIYLTSIFLFYLLLKKWMKETFALIITLLFSVHPLFVQVVAWIPGRNDSMLAVFVLGSILSVLNYFETTKIKWLVFYLMLLTAGLFTKESAVVIPVMVVVMGLFLGYRKQLFLPIGLSIAPLILWVWARNNAIQPVIKTGPNELFQALLDNIGLPIQSIGKMILPFNQSVFPMIEDTTYLYGLIVTILLLVVLVFGWKKSLLSPVSWIGLLWLILFMGPLLLVPREINAQAFEHRLFIPSMGLIIFIGPIVSTYISEENSKKLKVFSIVLGLLFIGLNIRHQFNFKNDVAFWRQAVETTPNSSYAEKMLGIKLYVRKSFKSSEKHIAQALELDSTERYANYYYGKLKLDQKDLVLAEKYMLREDSIHPGFFDAVFDLARVYFEKGEMEKVPEYLQKSIELRPWFLQAKNNLLVYYMKNNQQDKAKEFYQKWKQDGSGVPTGFDELK